MAFGNISTLYLPLSGLAGASLWGTDVRKLIDTAPISASNNTKTNHQTGTTAVVRTDDPYTTTTADLDQTLYGWAIQPTDMNSVAGARRRYPAGDHVATIRMGHTAAVAKPANLIFYAYRVSNAAGGRARTLLGSVSGPTESIQATGGEITLTATLTLGEIIFEEDETIQYSFETNAAGTVVTGDIITFFTGTQSGVAARIDTPQLSTLHTKSMSAVMDGTPAVERKNPKALTVVLDGTPTLVPHITTYRTLSAVMDGTVTLVRQVKKSLTAVMDGTASFVRKVARSLTVVMDGTPVVTKKTAKTLTVVMDGTPTLVRLVIAHRTLTAIMNGTPVLGRALVAARTLTAVMNGRPFGFVKFPWGSIPGGDCPSDWSPNDGLKSIEGDVFFHEPPNEGDPVAGAEVTLIRDSDGLRISTVFTDGAGHYTFPRDTNDPFTYHVEVRDGSQQGLSEEGCVPS